ncbi:MAG: DUF721 domain-containing protein [Geovibrio sp.]|nr:DUF721 domain-containing protein [Geovibrio sp.]
MKKISELLESKLAGEAREHSSLAKTWHHAVGDTVAAIAMPVKIDGACLIVGVSDNMWLSELSHMKDDILENLAEKGLNVDDVRFVFRTGAEKEAETCFFAPYAHRQRGKNSKEYVLRNKRGAPP